MRRVVITGVGIISPLGRNKEEHFSALLSGTSGVREIDLFDVSAMPVQIGGQVKDLDTAALAQKAPELADITDRKVWLGYLAAIAALKDAGLTSFEQLGINVGVSLEVLPLEKLVFTSKIDLGEMFWHYAKEGKQLQTPLDTLSRILIRKFKIQGPSYINCSACAASTQAIGHSFQKIRRGDLDSFLCGGFDSMLNPLGLGGFSLLGALSTKNELKEKACRPFDRQRTGTVLGEGAGMLVLEELDSALSRKAKIYGEITGYASSLDAYRATDPDPEGKGMQQAMQGALNDAGITPDTIEHINAHGTATIKNDLIEAKTIKNLFKNRATKIPVNATKSMTGHLIAAAGAIEMISSLTGFIFNKIHTTLNFECSDPECDLDQVAGQARPWKGNYILKNSFGFGGQNACLILKRFEA